MCMILSNRALRICKTVATSASNSNVLRLLHLRLTQEASTLHSLKLQIRGYSYSLRLTHSAEQPDARDIVAVHQLSLCNADPH